MMLEGLTMASKVEDPEGELSWMIEERGGIVAYSYIEAFTETKF